MLWMKEYSMNLLLDWAWILQVIKAYSIHDLYFVYVVEAMIVLTGKLNNYMSSFSSIPLVRAHLFYYVNFLYVGGLIS